MKKTFADLKMLRRILLFTVAVTKDVIDPIPVITILVDFFTAPYFLYFLLRYTKKEERILGFAITGLEMIPFVGILPMTTGSFFIIYKIMEKKHDQANAKE